jgi:hypothetical protein
MPYVTCPTCGERGKITSNLIGVRIKCRKCGVSFLVSPPAGKAVGAGAPAAGAAASAGPSAVVEAHGIEVEGLDGSSWAVPTEAGVAAATARIEAEVPAPGAGAGAPAEAASPFVPAASTSSGAREYKLLTSRDKYFDGKFDLQRLEEALNHFARLGWVAKAMSVPHFKGYSGALEEVVVVLLERCREAG